MHLMEDMARGRGLSCSATVYFDSSADCLCFHLSGKERDAVLVPLRLLVAMPISVTQFTVKTIVRTAVRNGGLTIDVCSSKIVMKSNGRHR